MMQSSYPQIWRNLGATFRTCGGIKGLNVVSFISILCLKESTTLTKIPFSYGFIVSLWIPHT